MRDPNTLGSDTRIQQERKAYFTREDTKRRITELRSQVASGNGSDEIQERLSALLMGFSDPEPRSALRARFAEWMDTVEDTSLEDILTLCALLEPVGDSPHLTPEMLLNAPRFGGILEEIQVAINFFMFARETSRLELSGSSQPSETTTEAPTPAEETSTPESTSP